MMYTIRVTKGKKCRDELHNFLNKKGIQSKVITFSENEFDEFSEYFIKVVDENELANFILMGI